MRYMGKLTTLEARANAIDQRRVKTLNDAAKERSSEIITEAELKAMKLKDVQNRRDQIMWSSDPIDQINVKRLNWWRDQLLRDRP